MNGSTMKRTKQEFPKNTRHGNQQQFGSLSTAIPESLYASTIQRKSACACGGSCPKCILNMPIQAKLKFGAPDNKYEQEADRVAEQVMRTPDPALQRYPVDEQPIAPQINPLVQRQITDEEQILAKPSDSSVTPMVQRYTDEEEENESLQRGIAADAGYVNGMRQPVTEIDTRGDEVPESTDGPVLSSRSASKLPTGAGSAGSQRPGPSTPAAVFSGKTWDDDVPAKNCKTGAMHRTHDARGSGSKAKSKINVYVSGCVPSCSDKARLKEIEKWNHKLCRKFCIIKQKAIGYRISKPTHCMLKDCQTGQHASWCHNKKCRYYNECYFSPPPPKWNCHCNNKAGGIV